MSTDNPEALPTGWAISTLGEIGVWRGGSTPSKSNPDYWTDADYPWVTPKDMKVGAISDSEDHLSEKALAEAGINLIPASSVLLVTRSGILSRMLPVAVTGQPVTINQDLKAITPFHGIDAEYIGWFFRFSATPILQSCSKPGTTVASINTEELKAVSIQIPLWNEQRRIVAKIEQLFSELDNGVESLKAARAQLKTYRQSLLKAAFEGRLTEEWRRENADNLETADELLRRIQTERVARYDQRLEEWRTKIREWEVEGRASQKPKKPSLVKGAEPFSDQDLSSLPELPQGWSWTPYSALCESIRNGVSKAPQDGDGDRILRISAVRPMAFDLEDYRRIENSSGEFDGYFLKRGDIVFTRYNGSRNYVGVAAVFRSDKPYLYPDKLIRTRVEAELVSPDYLEAAVNTGEARRFTESRIRTTAGQSGISGADIKRIPVPLCSYEEQILIADLLNSGLSRIQDLERSIEAAYSRSESLRYSILKRAFEGKLVPQDPDDEPASTLLKRIRAEQEEAPKPRQRRRKAQA